MAGAGLSLGQWMAMVLGYPSFLLLQSHGMEQVFT